MSYLKALDVWYAACMVFVFGALLEYAFVNVFVRSEKQESERMPPENTDPVLCIYTHTIIICDKKMACINFILRVV